MTSCLTSRSISSMRATSNWRPALLPDLGGRFLGDHAQLGQRVGGMGLDLEPDAEVGLGRPDRGHLVAGIAGDHGNFRLLREAFRPSGPPREAVVAPGLAADAVMDGEQTVGVVFGFDAASRA